MSAAPAAPVSAIDRDALARLGLPLARRLARTRARAFPPLADEFESAAYLGLAEAINAFKPTRGVWFTTFAKRRIIGAMLDAQRASGPLGFKRKTGDAPKIESLDVPVLDLDGTHPFADLIVADEDGPDVAADQPALEYLRGLTGQHRKVMGLLYGRADCLRMRQAGEALGLSETRISTIHQQAIAMIQKRLGLGGR